MNEVSRWGREVSQATVGGNPCLVYTLRPGSVAELLLASRRWSDREFLVQGDRRMTSGQHEQAVARVAAHLRGLGVERGTRVMILGFNRIEWVVTYWALQVLGAVAVLGNAWWSEEEAAGVLALAEPALVVTERQLDGFRTVDFETLRTVVVSDDIVELELTPVSEDDIAVIMFSSGTTGAPKGVIMSHRSVVANLQNLLNLTGRLPNELPADHPGTVSMLSVPLFHLAGVQISSTTLLSGGSLIFLSGKFDPAEVLMLIERERVKVWGSVPTMVSRVLDHPEFSKRDTSSVTSVPMGGSAISPELRQRVTESFSGVKSRVGSLYGLTEAGGVLAAGSGRDITDRPGCVGRALPVVQLRIKNPDADGVGEIQARTPTATYGYLGEHGGVADAEGWISTGDLGRIEEPNWLYVTGRSKDIIIRGGENISCAHVESAVLAHPDVLEAAAVALPHPDLGEEVGMAVVLRPGAAPDVDALLSVAKGRLARFELPSRWWLRTESLPTNPTGKILRGEVREAWVESGGQDIVDIAASA
ncbi:class I adenylate-forming enzyme family protein [Actinacidiphila oryziradicis]|uniref:Acyl--CoA ligase n=1 Tax=Actinacidiphila oryziradicis TaxID=2571141 RepID=A0A4U0SL70_9ACTN|nr:class I adenylate-forming enzyme family protein [Actinacidiphila oryziradicis]TKA01035.1 acyl--CoA ligase [Actinacidiphila oryziradicis]TKA05000.1 acyl--CoA ligase [Actinacidiphila oryziradicis]